MSVYSYGCISLDGYLADKNYSLDWLHQFGSIEETNYEDFYKSMDLTIMGKRKFDEIVENINNLYSTTKNYVFTHTENLVIKTLEEVKRYGQLSELIYSKN